MRNDVDPCQTCGDKPDRLAMLAGVWRARCRCDETLIEYMSDRDPGPPTAEELARVGEPELPVTRRDLLRTQAVLVQLVERVERLELGR